MQHALLLEFEPGDKDAKALYDAVTVELGLGDDGMPAGGVSHTAGMAETGVFTVFEVWETREAQEEFMRLQLMPALQKHGAPPPSRVVWVDIFAHKAG